MEAKMNSYLHGKGKEQVHPLPRHKDSMLSHQVSQPLLLSIQHDGFPQARMGQNTR